ncbi:chemotaxis protein CheW [bacterium F16]|nr:chemotaxis protein CheW [bacterium F16]
MAESAVIETLEHLAGKYLTFILAEESYGMEILKVQEIIGLMPITRVPRTPTFVRGVINLRGKVIPVVELRRKFEMDSIDDTEKSCIIVVQIEQPDGSLIMGLLVDEVSEVLDVAGVNIEPPPNFGMQVDNEFILGIGKQDNNVIMLLNVDKLLATNELEVVHQIEET